MATILPFFTRLITTSWSQFLYLTKNYNLYETNFLFYVNTVVNLSCFCKHYAVVVMSLLPNSILATIRKHISIGCEKGRREIKPSFINTKLKLKLPKGLTAKANVKPIPFKDWNYSCFVSQDKQLAKFYNDFVLLAKVCCVMITLNLLWLADTWKFVDENKYTGGANKQ